MDVTFELRRGEVVGLVGDNGAGKSTLVKCIAGVLTPSSGEIHLEGTQHEFAIPAEALEAGVETVYQDLALVELFDLDGEPVPRARARPRRAGSGRSASCASARWRRRPGTPSPSCRRASPTSRRRSRRCRAASARRRDQQGRVLGAHACCSSTSRPRRSGVQESAGVLEMISHAAERGDMAILVIAHNLQHIFWVCSRILVMRRGSLVADLNVKDTTAEDVVAFITGAR